LPGVQPFLLRFRRTPRASFTGLYRRLRRAGPKWFSRNRSPAIAHARAKNLPGQDAHELGSSRTDTSSYSLMPEPVVRLEREDDGHRLPVCGATDQGQSWKEDDRAATAQKYSAPRDVRTTTQLYRKKRGKQGIEKTRKYMRGVAERSAGGHRLLECCRDGLRRTALSIKILNPYAGAPRTKYEDQSEPSW